MSILLWAHIDAAESEAFGVTFFGQDDTKTRFFNPNIELQFLIMDHEMLLIVQFVVFSCLISFDIWKIELYQ